MKDMGDPEWLIEFKTVLDQQLYSSSSMSQHMESSETSSLQQQPDQQQQQVYYDDQGDFQISLIKKTYDLKLTSDIFLFILKADAMHMTQLQINVTTLTSPLRYPKTQYQNKRKPNRNRKWWVRTTPSSWPRRRPRPPSATWPPHQQMQLVPP